LVVFGRARDGATVGADLLGPGFGPAPVPRMEQAPLPDVVHVPLAFEVVGVLGAPGSVALLLPGLTTGRLVTIVLACAVAQIRAKWLAAMATGFLVF
jgi:hypothetical protein